MSPEPYLESVRLHNDLFKELGMPSFSLCTVVFYFFPLMDPLKRMGHRH